MPSYRVTMVQYYPVEYRCEVDADDTVDAMQKAMAEFDGGEVDWNAPSKPHRWEIEAIEDDEIGVEGIADPQRPVSEIVEELYRAAKAARVKLLVFYEDDAIGHSAPLDPPVAG